MKCPECNFPLDGTEKLCPRCLTSLSFDQGERIVKDDTGKDQASRETSLVFDAEMDRVGEILPEHSTRERAGDKRERASKNTRIRSPLAISAPSLFQVLLTLGLLVVTVIAFGILFASVGQKNAAHYLEQAQAYYQNGQYENALLNYLRAFERDSSSVAAQVGAGECYLGMDRPSLAIAHFGQAIEMEPTLISAHRGLGIAYSQAGLYPEAEASLKKAWDTRDYKSGSYLGYIYYQEQRYDEAIAILETVTYEKPESELAQEYLGRSLYAMERYDEALAPLQMAVEQTPDVASAREYLALVGYALGRCDWATEQFQILLAADPQNPVWYAYVGQCLLQQGQHEQAISYLNHALTLGQIDPVLRNSHLYLGQAYYEQGRYSEAIIYFQRALIMNPTSARAMAGLGWCYAAQERCDDARLLFEQALQLDPYQASARQGLERCP
jgi:tetratricopeptide (TPR) repeat protein